MKTKNKTRYPRGILVAIVAAAAVLVLSCVQPDGPSPDGVFTGRGSVVLSLSPVSAAEANGSVSKTILPSEAPAFSKYELTFTPDDPQVEGETKTVTDLNSYKVVLAAGDWTVEVTAYSRFSATAEYPAAKGSADFTVVNGLETEVEVTVKPIPITADDTVKGTFTYKVTFPDGAEGKLMLGEGGNWRTLVSGETVSIQKEPGYYKLSIILTKEEGEFTLRAGVLEEVHIYSGLESLFEPEFGDTAFTRTVYLAGTFDSTDLPQGFQADTTILPGIEVYSDGEYSVSLVGAEMITATLEGWLAGIPVGEIPEEDALYIKVTVTDTNGVVYTFKGDTGGAVPENGVQDIQLSYVQEAELSVEGEVTAADLKAKVDAAVAAGAEVYLENVTITGSGEVDFGTANVVVTGELDIESGVTVKVGGVFDLTDSNAEVAGTVTVASGGTIKSPALDENGLPVDGKQVSFGETGKVELAKGATGYYGELLFIGSDDEGFYKWGTDNNAKVTLKAGNVTEVSAGEVIAVNDTGIAAETSIVVADGAKLSIAEKVTYTVGGTLDVEGGLDVEGTLDVIGTLDVADGANVNVDGTFTTVEGSNGDLKGTITVQDGGVSYDLNPGGNSLWLAEGGSTGKYVFKAGSRAYVKLGDEPDPVLIIGGGNDDAKIQLASGEFSNTEDAYTLDGDATVAGEYGIALKTVTINGGILTVAADLALSDTTLNGGNGGATIILKDGKTISGAGNFYSSATPPEPIDEDITASGDQTYGWADNAGGTGTPGWKATNLITTQVTLEAGGSVKVTVGGEPVTTALAGEEVTLTVTINPGYTLADGFPKVNNGDVSLTTGANNTYTFDMPESDVTVAVEFVATNYNITIDSKIENGGVEANPTTTTIGKTVTLTVTPEEGYRLKAGSLKGTYDTNKTVTPTAGANNTYTFDMPAFDVEVTAEFEAISYNITVKPATNGKVEADPASTTIGETVTLTVTASEGYKLTEGSLTVSYNFGKVDLTDTGGNKYTFDMPAFDVEVTAEFEAIVYTVTGYNSTNGNVTPDKTTATIGETVTLTVSPTAGYTLDSLTGTKDGGGTAQITGSGSTYTFKMPAANVTVTAEFETAPQGTHTITVTPTDNGKVETNTLTAAQGALVTLTVTPNKGYQLKEGTLKVSYGASGTAQLTPGANNTYTFPMPDANVTVTAEFETAPAAAVTVTFRGPEDEYIADQYQYSLSWSKNEPLYVNVETVYDNYEWILDGETVQSGKTAKALTLYAGDYPGGVHILTIRVLKGGVPYTKILGFIVED